MVRVTHRSARCKGRRMTRPKERVSLLAGNRCQCRACGLPFSSVRGFDRHRMSSCVKPGQPPGNQRLTVVELEARGRRTNRRGFYTRPRLEHAQTAAKGLRMPLPSTQVPEP